MRSRKQGGQALLLLLIFGLVLAQVAFSLVVMTAGNTTASQNGVRRAVALSVAEIGVEKAKGEISSGSFDQQFAAQDHQATYSATIHTPESELYGGCAVHVTENHGGVDGQYLVVSQGTSGRTCRQISVVLQRGPADIPDVMAAITLYSPNSLATFKGVPPNVCGLDTDLPDGIPFSTAKATDCVPGSGDGPDAVGVGVHDDQSVTDILAALGKNPDRIVGTDGNGGSEPSSVYNVATDNPTGRIDTLSAADVVDLAEGYQSSADFIFDSRSWYDKDGSAVTSGSFGTTARPRVVVIRGAEGEKLSLAGSLTGVGLLIIDAQVEFKGTLNYAGLIMITRRGEATVAVEMMGTPLVMGAMIAANPADEATSMLDLRGTADVFFSSEGLGYAQQALTNRAAFETVFYMEEKPDADDLDIH